MKLAASLLLGWVAITVPSLAAAQPATPPQLLEAKARSAATKKAEGTQPVFLTQPGVITSSVFDTSGARTNVALYGRSGVMSTYESGTKFVARKHDGTWGTWREIAEAGWQCGTQGSSHLPETWLDGALEPKRAPGAKGAVPVFTIGLWYTTRFKVAVGGTHEDVVVSVAAAVAQLQEALTNTQISGQVAVSVVEETSYDDTSNDDVNRALSWFETNARSRRSSSDSDLFHLLYHGEEFGTVGRVDNIFNGNSGRAFGVTRNLAYGDPDTFVHEIGHHLGAGHSPENGCRTAAHDSCGHYLAGQVRDFMTYNANCLGCPVSWMFSDPNLPFSAGGVANGSASGIVNQRNNARTVAFAVPRVADFNGSASLPAPISIALGDALGLLLESDGSSIFADGFDPSEQ